MTSEVIFHHILLMINDPQKAKMMLIILISLFNSEYLLDSRVSTHTHTGCTSRTVDSSHKYADSI